MIDSKSGYATTPLTISWAELLRWEYPFDFAQGTSPYSGNIFLLRERLPPLAERSDVLSLSKYRSQNPTNNQRNRYPRVIS